MIVLPVFLNLISYVTIAHGATVPVTTLFTILKSGLITGCTCAGSVSGGSSGSWIDAIFVIMPVVISLLTVKVKIIYCVAHGLRTGCV